jgi:hypothetical protein
MLDEGVEGDADFAATSAYHLIARLLLYLR